MQNRATHIHLFGIGYSDPQLSNIPSGIYIRIGDIATAWTKERRAFSLADQLASVAYLAGVSRIDRHEGDSREFGLVLKKRAKLVKRPCTMPSPLSLPDGYSFSDTLQVFHGDPHAQHNSLIDDAFADGVIDNGGESRFSTFKPFQAFLAAGRAFALKRAPCLEVFVSYPIKMFRAILSSIGKGRYLIHSEVNAYKLLHIFDCFFGNLHGLEQKKLPLAVNKISLSLDVRKVFPIVAKKGELQSSINRPDGNRIFLIRKYPGIISDAAKGLKNALRFLVEFVSICHLGNATDKRLCSKAGRILQTSINKVMQFELIKGFCLPCYFGNLIAGCITAFEGIE